MNSGIEILEEVMPNDQSNAQHRDSLRDQQREHPPELYQVIIECRGEPEQRELFERLRREGRKVRLLVL